MILEIALGVILAYVLMPIFVIAVGAVLWVIAVVWDWVEGK